MTWLNDCNCRNSSVEKRWRHECPLFCLMRDLIFIAIGGTILIIRCRTYSKPRVEGSKIEGSKTRGS